MKKLTKSITFWFVIFSLLICGINLSGNDEYNLLIFSTNPINWILLDWLTQLNLYSEAGQKYKFLLYGLHLLFWVGVGLPLNYIIKRSKQIIKQPK